MAPTGPLSDMIMIYGRLAVMQYIVTTVAAGLPPLAISVMMTTDVTDVGRWFWARH